MWSRYERGVSKPSARTLLLATGLGLDVNYVLGGSRTVSEVTVNPTETAVIEDFRATDDEGRTQIARTARMEAQRVKGPSPFKAR